MIVGCDARLTMLTALWRVLSFAWLWASSPDDILGASLRLLNIVWERQGFTLIMLQI